MTPLARLLLWLAVGMSIFSGVRCAFVLWRLPAQGSLTLSQKLRGLLVGLRFDLSALLTAWIPVVAMLILPTPWQESRLWWQLWGWLGCALLVVMSFVLLADYHYFPSVGRHLGAELTLLGEDTGSMGALIWRSYKVALLFWLLLSATVVWIWHVSLQTALLPQPAPWPSFVVAGILAFLGIRGTIKGKSLNIVDAFRSGDSQYANILLNGVFSAYHASRSARRVSVSFFPSDELLTRIQIESVKDPNFPMQQEYEDNQPNGRNLVFVLLESWSNKYLDSFSGAQSGVTPNFDKIAADGLRFTNAYAAGQRSIHAIQASLTGVPSLPGMPYLGKGLEVSRLTSVGQVLKRHGYKSVFVKSSKRRSFRVDSIAKFCGFEEYWGWEDMPMLLDYPDPDASVFGWDHETFQFLLHRLNQIDQPFFGYMFTGVTHIPYPRLPPQFNKFPHELRGENGFLNTLHYGDWALGEFFAQAREQPWFDNTVFVLTADHPLGWYRTGRFAENFNVPIVLYAPGIIEAGENKTIVSHTDLMPTLLDLVGIPDPFSAMGTSLLRKSESWAVVEQGDVIGAFAESGYVVHSLQQRLEATTYGDQPLAESEALRIEERLLATAQLSLRLIRENRWFP